MFWNFVLGGCCPHTSPCASRVWRFLQIKQFPGIWTVSFFLSPRLRTFGFWILGDPHKSPSACIITLSFIVVPRIDQMSHVVRRIFLRSTGCATPSWQILPSLEPLVLALPSVNLHWKSLLDLSLTWRSAFPIGSERKMLKCLQENIEKLIMLNKRRRWSHSSYEKLLWLECQQVGFWCQHIWFGPWVQNCFCRTTNQAQLCGFLTRVSSSDFVL